jgi:putative flippase GtrA
MSKKRTINKKQRKLLVQFTEYMITGGVWFWSGYLLIVLLDEPLGLFWANVIGNAVGISLNFILNRIWVFKTKRQEHLHETAIRYVVYTFLNAFVLNYLILYLLREQLGIDPAIGQFIASAFFTVWNYFWYKVWVFKGQDQPKRARRAVTRKRG